MTDCSTQWTYKKLNFAVVCTVVKCISLSSPQSIQITLLSFLSISVSVLHSFSTQLLLAC